MFPLNTPDPENWFLIAKEGKVDQSPVIDVKKQLQA
jgi:hypothetical protein